MFIGIMFAIIGLVFLGLAIWQYRSTQNLLERGITTMAKIIDVKEGNSTTTDGEGYTFSSKVYTPEFEFTDNKGQKVRHMSNVSTSNKNAWKVGQEVEVIYDPANSDNVKIKKTTQLYLLTIVFGAIGGIFFIVGVAVAIFA